MAGHAGSWLSFIGVIGREKVTGEIAIIETRSGGLAVESPEHFLGRFDTVVLGFFEYGNAAEVGIGKEDATIEAGESAAFFGKDGANGGANHGVAHTHYINAGNALADVGVNALEVVQDGFFPVGPISFKEELAVLRRGTFSERPIEGPNRAVNVSAEALMHRVNVAEGGGIEKDGVPGRFGAARLGIAIEGEIGSKPGRIDKIVELPYHRRRR